MLQLQLLLLMFALLRALLLPLLARRIVLAAGPSTRFTGPCSGIIDCLPRPKVQAQVQKRVIIRTL